MWVLVMRPSEQVEYQVYDESDEAPPKPEWGKLLRKAGTTIITNFVWWWITK